MINQTTTALLTLRDLILNGSLPPGERLREVALSERLGVSRTPLRAALAQLESEGLVRSRERSGYEVRGFTSSDLSDSIELRGLLEGLGARIAAERGVDPTTLEQLHNHLDQIDHLIHGAHSDVAFEHYVDLNQVFHHHLSHLGQSDLVAREIKRVCALPFASPSAFVMAQAALENSWEILVIAQHQHRGILDAISLRQGSRAETLAQEHARIAHANLQIALNSSHVPLRLVSGEATRSSVGGPLR